MYIPLRTIQKAFQPKKKKILKPLNVTLILIHLDVNNVMFLTEVK